MTAIFNIIRDSRNINCDIMIIPSGGSLPVADVSYRSIIAILQGAGGAPDTKYVCMKNTANAYNWVKIFDGDSNTIMHQATGL
jgi:hypothetical protein